MVLFLEAGVSLSKHTCSVANFETTSRVECGPQVWQRAGIASRVVHFGSMWKKVLCLFCARNYCREQSKVKELVHREMMSKAQVGL